MKLKIDHTMLRLVGGTVSLLVLASGIGAMLGRRPGGATDATLTNFNARLRAWWVLVGVYTAAWLLGPTGSIALFGVISFLALREFITLTPTRQGDHRALFWIFFVITPLQYYLVAIQAYDFFTVLIPIYAFLFIPIRNAIAGDCEQFLERTAKIQWALMVCVYCVSYAPALLALRIPGYQQNAVLLFYFVLVVQLSDVLQYCWGKTCGRRLIAPRVSPHKTWEGFLGGVLSATAVGTALWWATPFSPAQAFGMSLAITLMGFGGGLVMSAIKRDRRVKDYGTLLPGHGGMLDRIDSLCFAAPVFYLLTRHFFT